MRYVVHLTTTGSLASKVAAWPFPSLVEVIIYIDIKLDVPDRVNKWVDVEGRLVCFAVVVVYYLYYFWRIAITQIQIS